MSLSTAMSVNLHEICLIGDSQFLRYKNFLMGNNQNLRQGITVIGSLCISGITTCQLKKQLKTATTPLPSHSTIVVSIGTNDIVRQTSLANLKKQFLSLIRFLRRNFTPQLILILTIPQFPRFLHKGTTVEQIDQVNKYLATLKTNDLRILELPTLTQNSTFLFEKYYYPSGRPDGIHLNKNAFKQLSKIICDELKQFNSHVSN